MEPFTPLCRDQILEQERLSLRALAAASAGDDQISMAKNTHKSVIADASSHLTKESYLKLREWKQRLENNGLSSNFPQCICSTVMTPLHCIKQRLINKDRQLFYWHIARLKSRGLYDVWQPFSHFLHLASLLAANLFSHQQKHKRLTTFILLLLAILTQPAMAQDGSQSQQKSRSSSPFQSWVVADSSPVTMQAAEHRTFQFPDFLVPVNHLFQYQLPWEEFGPDLHYQVCSL